MALLCGKCGTPNRAGAIHCVRCGNMLGAGTDAGNRKPARPKPQREPSIDFLEDETVMNRAARTPSERPAIRDVGFNKRVSPDREETPVSSLAEPWEEIVDATSRPLARRSKASVPTVPVPEKSRSVLPPRRAAKGPAPAYDRSLDADTDEGVVSVPPDPDQFASLQPIKNRPRAEPPRAEPPPQRRPIAPSELPSFGTDSESWPSGATKPLAKSLKKRNDLLENKPVTGARKPPTRQEAHGETVAAPGELAGIVDKLPPPARPELVDDLMSPAALRTQEREHRRAELRKSVETTSPEELRSMRRPPPPPPMEPLGIEPTKHVPAPGQRLEETRALVENPLPRSSLSAPISDILPLPAIEDTARRADARPFGQTQVILQLASGTKRALAIALDAFILLAVVAVPGLLGVFGEGFSTANWLDPDDVSLLLMRGDLTIPLVLLVVLGLISSAIGHAVGGRSLGKLAFGLEVVRKKTGQPIGPVRAVLRAFLSLFSVALGGAGYLWLLVDRRGRTFHDYFCGTVVVISSSRSEGSSIDERFAREPTL